MCVLSGRHANYGVTAGVMKKHFILVPARAMQCMLGFRNQAVHCFNCAALPCLQQNPHAQETSIRTVARVCVHSKKQESKQMCIRCLA